MDRRDHDLLDKQLAHLNPPPRKDGTMMLAIVAVFLAGVTAGAFLFSRRSEMPVQTAAMESAAATDVPIGTVTIAR